MKFAIFSVIFSLMMPAPLLAQAPAEKAFAMVRFAYLQMHPETPDPLYLLTSEGVEALQISSRTPREYHKIQHSTGVLLGVKGENAEQAIVPLASQKLPAAARKLTALLSPADEAGKYQITFLDESKFKPGCVFFINQTGSAIGVTIDEKRFLVRASSEQLVPFASGKDSRNVFCSFHEKEVDGSFRLLNESTWNISRERAEICVFYKDLSLNRIKSRGM
ncbi:MAG: hypothetical protein ACO3RV_03455 [Luteolibacter sp.]